ncbi:MAG: N-acetyltransferase [Micromonosporaceae bacterium]
MTELEITTLAERPELRDAAGALANHWPAFMLEDIVADAYWGQLHDTFSEFILVGLHEGEVIARGISVPFALDFPGRGALPPDGWDRVMVWAFANHRSGAAPDTVSAIEILIDPKHQGRGLAAQMVAAMRENVRKLGFDLLVAPVRPTAKHHEPTTPMSEYAFRTRDDGLPHDPWLRVHVRAGGGIEKVAPTSMVISGSLAQWREWTGLPFDTDGPIEVPGALSPVECRQAHDYAVYVEPNVWVRHDLTKVTRPDQVTGAEVTDHDQVTGPEQVAAPHARVRPSSAGAG